MKQTLFVWMFLLAASTGTIQAQVNSLVIKTTDGTESVKQLSTVQQLSFYGGNLMLKYLSGTSDAFTLSNIKVLYFKSLTNGIDNPVTLTNSDGVMVYPNPAGDVIYVRNIPNGRSQIAIFRMDGTLTMNATVTTDPGAINVSPLERGLYFLRINGQSFKIIKL